MSLDSYPSWIPRVRKDPLGPVGYNNLILGQQWCEWLLSHEHIIGGDGRHNAVEVPREVGGVYFTAGPTGNVEGFNSATPAVWTATGTSYLTINPALYSAKELMALQVTNTSETGLTKPCVTSAQIDSTSQIFFYSKALTSALGAGNAWAAEDASFSVGIHGMPLNPGIPSAESGLRVKGDWFTAGATEWNAHVAADAKLRATFLIEHSAAGKHISREVARTWARITWDGGTLGSTSSARNPVSATTRVALGIYELTFTNAWSLPAQPFVMQDWARSNRVGGASQADIFVCCCPRSMITTTKVRFYIYKYDPVALTWARADADLFAVVHGGP